MLLDNPVHVGLVVYIICTALGEFGFHRGKSTYILPVVLRVFFGVRVIVREDDESPMRRELGVREAAVRVSGWNPLIVPPVRVAFEAPPLVTRVVENPDIV